MAGILLVKFIFGDKLDDAVKSRESFLSLDGRGLVSRHQIGIEGFFRGGNGAQ